MPKSALTGSRIREHRLMRGLKQAELARLSGISASYLNLIEHNRRRIGGKTLLTLSQVLGIDPSQLSQGAEQGVVSALQNAAAADVDADGAQTPVELDQIDDLVARFPGWAAKITAQHQRLQALEQQMDGLNDRLTHDPVLSEKMHEVLSTVAAIRSTASILVGNPDLDADWQSRFYSCRKAGGCAGWRAAIWSNIDATRHRCRSPHLRPAPRSAPMTPPRWRRPLTRRCLPCCAASQACRARRTARREPSVLR